MKILTQFFTELERAICKFIWNNKKPSIAKTILKNKRTSGGIIIPDLKLYCRAIVIKTAWYWYSDRQVDQWNRIDDPEMDPHTYGHLIFDKGAKTTQWKKRQQPNGAGSTGGYHVEECEFIHSYLLVQSSSLSGSRNSTKKKKKKKAKKQKKNRDTETYRGDSGEKPWRYGHRGNFLNRTAMACALRLIIDKWDLIKLQNFCKAKENIKKTKGPPTGPPTDWEKIFTNPQSNRGLISNIYKEFKK